MRFTYSYTGALRHLPCCLLLLSLAACTGTTTQPVDTAPAPTVVPEAFPAPQDIASCWKPVVLRLRADGIAGPDVDGLFRRLGDTASQDPMGRKVKELYTTKYLKPPPSDTPPTGKPRPRLYPGVVTDENARKCRAFVEANKEAFVHAESTYGVPRNVAVSLLFVETRLGTNLGKRNAFETLASMAASTSPDSIPVWLAQLPDSGQRLDWISEKMRIKSDWAYLELRALIRHSRANGLDPMQMPGSIYGAIGICQFMPTSLLRYGADGDGDGRVDLFTTADAVASLGRYLKENGWKPGMDRTGRHKALRRYNNLAIYADTILTLADRVATVDGTDARASRSTVTR